jgi:hypothetical protein
MVFSSRPRTRIEPIRFSCHTRSLDTRNHSGRCRDGCHLVAIRDSFAKGFGLAWIRRTPRNAAECVRMPLLPFQSRP